MDISAIFDDVTSPGTADCDDIDFDINTPRDSISANASSDLHNYIGHQSEHNEIPSIVITEPSSANLADLDDEFDKEREPITKDNSNKARVSKAEVWSSQVISDTTPSPTYQNDVNNGNLKFGRDEEDPTDIKELQSTDCSNKNPSEDLNTVVNQDELVGNEVGNGHAEGSNENTSPTEIVGEEIEAPVEFQDIQIISQAAQSIALDNNVTDQVDETVSLENILMKEKTESDSDDEFDFDLPAGVSGGQPSVGSPPQPPKPQTTNSDVQAKLQDSVTTAKPIVQADLISTGSPTPFASSSDTQKPASTSSQEQYTGSPTPQTSSSSTQKPIAVIKPTAQAPYIVQPPPDEGTQRVLEAAQAEWDKVTTIQAGYKETDTSVQGAEPTVVETVQAISPHELLQIFKQEDFTSVRSSIKPAVERHGFAAFVNFLFGPPKLHRDLLEERDVVFCIAASQLSNENSSHIRTLQTIYRCLTGSKFDCPRIGSHWEEIGFQGNDPATDLRGAGLLGLMNLLHLLKDPKKYQLASDIYRLSLHPTQNFPFCVMGINLSRITLQTLREGLLNKECNRRHDVIGVVNDFYVGLYLQLYKVWKGQGKTISDSGYVIKDIEMRAKKSPRDVFRNLDEFLNKKTVIVKEKSFEPGGDNFINVCDDTT